MAEKKEQNKFTIQFNPVDPTHRQVIGILNQQGRRKAQFLVNAVQHYLHCPETPDVYQTMPVDICAIEEIVRNIIKEQKQSVSVSRDSVNEQPSSTKIESINHDEAVELLGKEGLAVIASTVAAFRKTHTLDGNLAE